MSVRETHIFDDIQACFYELINKMVTNTAPWTSWSVYKGYPMIKVLTQFIKPIIYILPPQWAGDIPQQGGKPSAYYEMIIGMWDDRKTGGTEEINIISSRIYSFFRDPAASHAQIFTVVHGATTYTDTTLIAQRVSVVETRGTRDLDTTDEEEFRKEMILKLRA